VKNWNYLEPSETTTCCPYKGEANYYDVNVNGAIHRDLVWYYKMPIQEAEKIKGMLCFYNEKVDIWLDGKKLEKPPVAI